MGILVQRMERKEVNFEVTMVISLHWMVPENESKLLWENGQSRRNMCLDRWHRRWARW